MSKKMFFRSQNKQKKTYEESCINRNIYRCASRVFIWWENKIDSHIHMIYIERVHCFHSLHTLHKIQNSIKFRINLLLIKLVQIRYSIWINVRVGFTVCVWSTYLFMFKKRLLLLLLLLFVIYKWLKLIKKKMRYV